MKKLLLILLCLPMIGLGQITEIEAGYYSILKTSGHGWDLGKLQKSAFSKIQSFAKEQNKILSTISIEKKRKGEESFGSPPSIEVIFRLSNDSSEYINYHKSKTNLSAGKYDKLLKLGHLRKEGIISHYEFGLQKYKLFSTP
jgi:hypothetical protein